MGEKDIKKALNLADILEGIRIYLEKDNHTETLIDISIANINSSYSFERQKDIFKKYILIDFSDIIQYTKEDEFDEETYFSNRKTLKEFDLEYHLFYTFLSEYVLKNKVHEHKDIKRNLSYIFGTTYASKHKK